MSFFNYDLKKIALGPHCSIKLLSFCPIYKNSIIDDGLLEKIVNFDRDNFEYFWSNQCWESSLCAGYILLIAFDRAENKILGIILGKISPKESLVHILKLIVKTDFRKRGLGKMLLQKARCAMGEKGIFNYYLEVRSDNLAAIYLYEACDYQKLILKRNFYGQGKDGYSMLLEKSI